MSEGANAGSSIDPMELWKQWNDTTSKAWSQVLESSKETHVDPYGLYQSWLQSINVAQEQTKSNPLGTMDPKEAWKQWLEATTAGWRKVGTLGSDPLGLTTQWLEMMEAARAKMQAEGTIPGDPFTFFKQWYDATSETWSQVVGDVIGTEKFVEAMSRFLENYTSFYKTFRRTNEEYLKNLQLPSRSDIARVAELVIALEEKVDHIEDAFEDFEDERLQVATSEAVAALAGRLDRLESKLDTVLAALMKIETQQRPEPVPPKSPKAGAKGGS